MRLVREQRGQAAAEYLGVVVVIAAILAAIVASGVGEKVTDTLGAAVCQVAGRDDCETSGGSDEEPTESEDEIVERYIDSSLEDYLDYRDSEDRDPRLDYSNDGCSAPLVGSTGVSFDFTDACIRHDFGYRNTKDLGTFDELKPEIDGRFLDDMLDHCSTRSVFLRGRCREWAYTFYGGVVAFG